MLLRVIGNQVWLPGAAHRCTPATDLLLDRLGLFKGFVDRADHVEGLFGQCIAFAVNNHLEATDRFLQRHILTRVPVNTSATWKGWERKR